MANAAAAGVPPDSACVLSFMLILEGFTGNISEIARDLLDVHISSLGMLDSAVDVLFNKALDADEESLGMYVELCNLLDHNSDVWSDRFLLTMHVEDLAGAGWYFNDSGQNKQWQGPHDSQIAALSKGRHQANFKRLLLKRCQQEFMKDGQYKLLAVEEAGDTKVRVSGRALSTEADRMLVLRAARREEAYCKIKRRMISNISFMGRLYCIEGMLTAPIMHYCIGSLLHSGTITAVGEDDCDALFKLLALIGAKLEAEDARAAAAAVAAGKTQPHLQRMGTYIGLVYELSHAPHLAYYVRLKMRYLYDLRANKWNSGDASFVEQMAVIMEAQEAFATRKGGAGGSTSNFVPTVSVAQRDGGTSSGGAGSSGLSKPLSLAASAGAAAVSAAGGKAPSSGPAAFNPQVRRPSVVIVPVSSSSGGSSNSSSGHEAYQPPPRASVQPRIGLDSSQDAEMLLYSSMVSRAVPIISALSLRAYINQEPTTGRPTVLQGYGRCLDDASRELTQFQEHSRTISALLNSAHLAEEDWTAQSAAACTLAAGQHTPPPQFIAAVAAKHAAATRLRADINRTITVLTSLQLALASTAGGGGEGTSSGGGGNSGGGGGGGSSSGGSSGAGGGSRGAGGGSSSDRGGSASASNTTALFPLTTGTRARLLETERGLRSALQLLPASITDVLSVAPSPAAPDGYSALVAQWYSEQQNDNTQQVLNNFRNAPLPVLADALGQLTGPSLRILLSTLGAAAAAVAATASTIVPPTALEVELLHAHRARLVRLDARLQRDAADTAACVRILAALPIAATERAATTRKHRQAVREMEDLAEEGDVTPDVAQRVEGLLEAKAAAARACERLAAELRVLAERECAEAIAEVAGGPLSTTRMQQAATPLPSPSSSSIRSAAGSSPLNGSPTTASTTPVSHFDAQWASLTAAGVVLPDRVLGDYADLEVLPGHLRHNVSSGRLRGVLPAHGVVLKSFLRASEAALFFNEVREKSKNR